MIKKLLACALMLSAVWASACSNETSSTNTGAGAGGTAPNDLLPCEVSDMLQARCQLCHGTDLQGGAPMPMVTRSDLLAETVSGSGSVAEVSVARMQAENRMPPPPNEAATAAEIAVLQQWIDAGQPARAAGEQCGGSGGGGTGGMDPGCTPDLQLAAQAPFEMPATSTDEQVCFGIDVPATQAKRHITAILPRIDNNTIIHHILFLQSPTSVSPDPQPCNFTQQEWKLLYAWGPGTPAHVLPPEAGFPIEAGETAHFVMQVHYNNLQGLVGEMDQSGIDLCTTEDLRPNDADIMAFGSMQFALAPSSTNVVSCDRTIPAIVAPFFPITIFQSWPHMHQLGTGMFAEVRRPDSSTELLVDVPDYSFDYQVTYPNNVVINTGDVVHTSCTWNNTTTNTVGFGEDTANEMCFNFVSYYPRINSPQWHWLLPAADFDQQCTTSTQ